MRKGNFRFAVIAIGLAVMLAMPAVRSRNTPRRNRANRGATGDDAGPAAADNNVNWPGAGYGAGALLCNCSTSRPSWCTRCSAESSAAGRT